MTESEVLQLIIGGVSAVAISASFAFTAYQTMLQRKLQEFQLYENLGIEYTRLLRRTEAKSEEC